MSEAIHSLLDLFSATVAFFTVQIAAKPADHDHPFGHGKIETLSALFEGLLLWVAAAFMAREGVLHFLDPAPLQHTGWAIATMAVSLLISLGIFWNNSRAAMRTGSSALQMNALHFLSDTVTSLAVLVGLAIVWVTGWSWIDPLLAFGVAIYIIIASYGQLKIAIHELTDAVISPLDRARVFELIQKSKQSHSSVLGVHDFRGRKSGSSVQVDFHLSLCALLNLREAHDISEDLEQEFKTIYPEGSIVIHLDPCTQPVVGGVDEECKRACPRRSVLP